MVSVTSFSSKEAAWILEKLLVDAVCLLGNSPENKKFFTRFNNS